MKRNRTTKSLAIVLLLVLFLLIFAESNFLNNKNILFKNMALYQLILSSMALTVFLWLFPRPRKNSLARIGFTTLKCVLISLTVFLLFVEASIIDFAGMTFGPEVVFHFNWDAFVLGVKQYALPMLLIVLLIALINLAIFHLDGRSAQPVGLFGFFMSCLLLTVFFQQTIYGRISKGYAEYDALMNVRGVYESEIRELAFLDVNPINVSKSEVVASANQTKNLIIIYLESFSRYMVNNPRYPRLTPKLSALAGQHIQPKAYVSTGHFTMDGLISAHCGFIPNMAMGNNTLATGEKYYYDIPCLTDVLSAAGYHQEFMGGAKKSFAGKGDFLLDHGYDQVWGREDFEDNFGEQMTWWGLEDDELFNQAKMRIKAFSESEQPFHLSLLTLATHLKGFPPASCPRYSASEDTFLQAIHCTDHLVGDFIDHLDEQGLLNNTTVIITGDHSLFSTSYTQDLFGQEVENEELFGLIIDPEMDQVPDTMGLYDIAPTALDLLGVEHNVSFILGDAYGGPSDRPLITRDDVYLSGEKTVLSTDCHFDLNKKIQPKLVIDLCDHRALINKLFGYTEQFSRSDALALRSSSTIEITYNEALKKILSITTDGRDMKQHIRHDGFIADPDWYSRKGLYLLKTNHLKGRFDQLLNIRLEDKLLKYLQANQPDKHTSLIVFGIKDPVNQPLFDLFNEHLSDVQCFAGMVCTAQVDRNSAITTEINNQTIQLKYF